MYKLYSEVNGKRESALDVNLNEPLIKERSSILYKLITLVDARRETNVVGLSRERRNAFLVRCAHNCDTCIITRSIIDYRSSSFIALVEIRTRTPIVRLRDTSREFFVKKKKKKKRMYKRFLPL